MKLLVPILALVMLAANARAELGWTWAECVQAYGDPVSGPDDNGVYVFQLKDYTISAIFVDHKMACLSYRQDEHFNGSMIAQILSANGHNAQWSGPMSADGGRKTWVGRVTG